MSRPKKSDYDDNDIHEYYAMLEEYVDDLLVDIDRLENQIDDLEEQIDDLENEVSNHEDTIDGLLEIMYHRNSILDDMTRDWLSDTDNWDIVKKLATANQFDSKSELEKYAKANPKIKSDLLSLLTSFILGVKINDIDSNEFITSLELSKI
jgi:predicted nuclease with TOPRIM domain